jgi:hypothetical protein
MIDVSPPTTGLCWIKKRGKIHPLDLALKERKGKKSMKKFCFNENTSRYYARSLYV